MVTLERMLFDVTEAWQYMGLIAADHYVTVELLAVLVAPLQGRMLAWLFTNETFNKYLGTIIITTLFGIFIITGNYGAILISVLLMMFVCIVYTYPQYKSIQDFIDRVFKKRRYKCI